MLIFVAKIVKILNSLPKNKLSICIVSEQLATGGAERCAALLSDFLVANEVNVHHLITINRVEYPFSGSLFNMGLLKNDSNPFNKMFRFWKMFLFFRQHKFDYIIDSRVKNHFLQEFFISKFIYNAPLLVWVHSFMTDLYFPKNPYFARFIYNKHLIISVSKTIENKIKQIYNFENVITIHNPIATKDIELQSNQSFNFTDKYIISAGSLKNNIKQFDVLISCYLQSNLPNKSIKLIVMGDGVLLEQLKIATKRIDLQNNVVFVGQQINPYIYFKNALFSVLTSKNEGFPMVLLESLACGTPVISFDCESGPSEIIDNELNGLLVENQNQQKMIFALNEMANNEKLYLHCKSNSKESVSGFSITNIGQQWLQIMK